MATIPQVSAALRHVLTTVADEAAVATGFVRRRSKLTGARFVQTLVFGWLADPDASLDALCRVAGALGVPIRPQGLAQRFTARAAACLRRVLEAAVGTAVVADPVVVPLLARFRGVWVDDCTVVRLPAACAADWPGCGNASSPAARSAGLKLRVGLELRTGALAGPRLAAARTHDRATPAWPLPAGALYLADLGFFVLARLRALTAAEVWWLSRLPIQTRLWVDGGCLSPPALLAAAPGATLDRPVRLGATERLPARLLAVRVAPEVAAERRRRLKAEARRRGQMVSAARLAVADWTVLVTNLPPDHLTLDEALVLARARWQIELLFKLWKSHGGLARSRSANPERILCERYAKLLALLAQHWLILATCWRVPDRSLPKAARAIRLLAVALAAAFDRPAHLRAMLNALARCLTTGARLDTRKTRPSTYQRLLALDPLAPIHDHADAA